MPYVTILYARDTLYQELWAQPTSEVAKRYGVSDVTLAKVCAKLDVPRPPRGYWARKAAGHAVTPTPLPALKRGAPTELKVHRCRMQPPTPASAEELAFLARPEFQAKPVSLPFELSLPATLDKPHRFVAATLRALRKLKPNDKGLLWAPHRDALPVDVSPAQLDRALRLLDALLGGVERAGHRILPADERHGWRLLVEERPVTFRIRERLNRRPHQAVPGEPWPPAYDFIPSGELTFTFVCGERFTCENGWKDSSRHPLETQLNELFLGLFRLVAHQQANEARRLAREALEREQAARKEEAARQRAREQAQANELVEMAERWERARLVRAFAREVRAEAERRLGPLSPDGTALQWLDFAEHVASGLDPIPGLFAPRPPS